MEALKSLLDPEIIKQLQQKTKRLTVNNKSVGKDLNKRLRKTSNAQKLVFEPNKIMPNHVTELATIDGQMHSNIDLSNYKLEPDNVSRDFRSNFSYTEEQSEPPIIAFPNRRNRGK